MINNKKNWQLFEQLVKKILEANGFKLKRNAIRGSNGFDFLGKNNSDTWAIEVKYYRSSHVGASLLKSAATRVLKNGIEQKADKGMLVTSSILSSELRHSLENDFNIVFVDRFDLYNYARVDSSLLEVLPTE